MVLEVELVFALMGVVTERGRKDFWSISNPVSSPGCWIHAYVAFVKIQYCTFIHYLHSYIILYFNKKLIKKVIVLPAYNSSFMEENLAICIKILLHL